MNIDTFLRVTISYYILKVEENLGHSKHVIQIAVLMREKCLLKDIGKN